MTDDPESLGPGGAEDDAPNRGSPPPTPRWVIALALAAAVLVLAFLAIVAAGGHEPSTFQH